MWLLLSISVLKPVFWELKALQISSKPVEQREMTTQELKQIVHFNHKNIFNRAIGSAQYVLKKKNGHTWVRHGIVAQVQGFKSAVVFEEVTKLHGVLVAVEVVFREVKLLQSDVPFQSTD